MGTSAVKSPGNVREFYSACMESGHLLCNFH